MAEFLFFGIRERRVKETPLSLLPPLKQNSSGRIPRITPFFRREATSGRIKPLDHSHLSLNYANQKIGSPFSLGKSTIKRN